MTMPFVQTNSINKSYGKIKVLHDVSIDIHEREAHVVIGPNGAGKTTLFKVLTGEVLVNSGIVRLKGKQVIRKAGWDCHGLPVEIAVEKELGFTGKADIEKFGVAAFNEKCKESVQRHVDEFTDMTKRMGFWVDFDEAYWTMSPEYIESVWWSLQQIWKKGLLVQDHRVAPYCPRCGTGLSDHELAQGYETIKDPSVYVRFPATSGKLAELKASFLVWTTTPWTLVSNTAVAVNPKVEYQVVEVTIDEKVERLVVATELASVLGEDRKVIASFIGKDLEHTKYTRPFDFVEINDAHFVVLADYFVDSCC